MIPLRRQVAKLIGYDVVKRLDYLLLDPQGNVLPESAESTTPAQERRLARARLTSLSESYVICEYIGTLGCESKSQALRLTVKQF